MKFSGHDYRRDLDEARLTEQIGRVLDAMLRAALMERWLTVAEIGKEINLPGRPFAPETSISAQIRNLRKPANGHYIIDGRRRSGTSIYEYRLVGQITPDDVAQGEMEL